MCIIIIGQLKPNYYTGCISIKLSREGLLSVATAKQSQNDCQWRGFPVKWGIFNIGSRIKCSWTGTGGEVVLGGAITAGAVGFRCIILALALDMKELISSVCSTSASVCHSWGIFASRPDISSCFFSFIGHTSPIWSLLRRESTSLEVSLSVCDNFVRCALNPHRDEIVSSVQPSFESKSIALKV